MHSDQGRDPEITEWRKVWLGLVALVAAAALYPSQTFAQQGIACADRIAPIVQNEPLGDEVYAAACRACTEAVMSKFGGLWSTPGRFADVSQYSASALIDQEVSFVTGRRFTTKELQVACMYDVKSGNWKLFEDRSKVGTYGTDDK